MKFKNNLIAIAELWFKAFNEHDLEALLALYHSEARHYSPKLKIRIPATNGLVIGKDALRAWWKDCFERIPSLRYVPQQFIVDKSALFMEYTRHVEGEEMLLVGEVLEIKENLIFSSRVYHG